MRSPYLFVFRLILMVSAVIYLFFGIYDAALIYDLFAQFDLSPNRLFLEAVGRTLFITATLLAASEIVRLLQLVERHLSNIDTTLSLQYSRENRIEIQPHVPPDEDYYRPPNERFRR